jgi:hypothetical protein
LRDGGNIVAVGEAIGRALRELKMENEDKRNVAGCLCGCGNGLSFREQGLGKKMAVIANPQGEAIQRMHPALDCFVVGKLPLARNDGYRVTAHTRPPLRSTAEGTAISVNVRQNFELFSYFADKSDCVL